MFCTGRLELLLLLLRSPLRSLFVEDAADDSWATCPLYLLFSLVVATVSRARFTATIILFTLLLLLLLCRLIDFTTIRAHFIRVLLPWLLALRLLFFSISCHYDNFLSLLLQLILFEILQAEVLALDKTLQVGEGLLELLEDVGRFVTVARRVILRVHRVHDYKHLLTLRRLRVERHFKERVNPVKFRVETVRVEV